MNYYSPYIQRSTRIMFWSPLCLSQDLNNWPVIKPLLYLYMVHISQTDESTHKWIFHSKTYFAKLSNLMPRIFKLYLFHTVRCPCILDLTLAQKVLVNVFRTLAFPSLLRPLTSWQQCPAVTPGPRSLPTSPTWPPAF